MPSSMRIARKPVGGGVIASEVNLEQHDAKNSSATRSLLNSSLDEGEEIEKLKAISDRRQQSIFEITKSCTKSWGIELLALLVVAGAVAGVILTLIIYDNQVLSHWNFPLSLNTLVAVLSQIAQMALMVPITACISQLKWLWFINSKTPQPLSNFEAFDAASRSFYGSLLLVGRTHSRFQVTTPSLRNKIC